MIHCYNYKTLTGFILHFTHYAENVLEVHFVANTSAK